MCALVTGVQTCALPISGILYLFSPQIEQHLYAHLDHVQPRGARLALDTAIAAARSAMPHGASLNAVFPAQKADDSVRVLFTPPRPASAMRGHQMHGAAPAAPLSPWIADAIRSEEHKSELQSLMRISYAVFCLKK